MSAPPFVELRGLRKTFGSKRVLDGVDLRVETGSVFTILGGSGSGKSVTLKHIIGLLRPDAGEVWIEGTNATDFSESQWVEIRRRFGYVFQGAALFDSLSVYENVAYPLREHLEWPEAQIAERVAESLAAVGLPGVERMLPAELSGGMRKRVGVARAVALHPKAILYDEPTTGLDPANSRRIGQLILRLKRSLDVTSVVVTHDLELCFAISDRIALLQDGRMIVEGTPDVLRASTHPAVHEFMHGGTEAEPVEEEAAHGS
ncbi:MAG: ABC transporter ATP-binding protein [Proteobacteria bacterium]|nr:ABC transporter ATP-binding protein [Pseudomonadota bacterium]